MTIYDKLEAHRQAMHPDTMLVRRQLRMEPPSSGPRREGERLIYVYECVECEPPVIVYRGPLVDNYGRIPA